MDTARENYGIDAPTVVRNFVIIGIVLTLVSAGTGLLVGLGTLAPGDLTRLLIGNGGITAAMCFIMSFWMFASSKWLKARVAGRLLDMHEWRGDEAVLDIGCGRGLVAIAAARRVPAGKVTGVDIWQEQDLGGNTPEAIRANAVAAGVAGRLQVDTGDARTLPYAEASFDVVASMTALHNIPGKAGRIAAIAEAWRVTKPGGDILIFDIRHARTYAAQLRVLGAEVRLKGPILLWGPIGWRFSAHKPG
jgi:SAM-dependent methyltransferase